MVIEEGDRVRVIAREELPLSKKYAGQTGSVTMIYHSVRGPLFFVHIDGNPGSMDTSFVRDDLEEVRGEQV